MAVKVEIPSPLREHTGGQTEVAVSGSTVQAALDDLVRQFPSIGPNCSITGSCGRTSTSS